MKTETLLQILFANGHENLVALAVKLDNGIEDTNIPQSILVECDKKYIPAGMKTKGDKGYWIQMVMPVIGYNKYKVKDQFLIQYPDGTTSWKSPSGGSSTELVPIEEAAVAVL